MVAAHPLLANRELSFLEYNQRIVQEAADPDVPLLERLKFAAIVGANLDEFFMVRVAGLHQQIKSGLEAAGPDGMSPSDQLGAIRARVARQVRDLEAIALDELFPALAGEGIRIRRAADLDEGAKDRLQAVFETRLLGRLTPLAVDPGHPFPLLRNRSLNLAVHLRSARCPNEDPRLAVVQIPPLLPRFVPLSDGADAGAAEVVFVEDAIQAFAGSLFFGMRIVECAPFRVLRNWDLAVDEDEQEDLLAAVEKELQRRWRLDAVRLEVDASASAPLVDRLRRSVGLEPEDVARYRGPLAWADWGQLKDGLDRPDLVDAPLHPVAPADFAGPDLFAAIRKRDLLLHHPYESYEPVVRLIEDAASDPRVLAIKQTLYRVNRGSPILRSLVRAAETGKQVTVLVELKARFDEEVKVEWARQLEEAGAHVVYGLIGLKTHCNLTLIVRREGEKLRRYVHLGTGDHDERTARIYSDLSLFTVDDAVGQDVSSLFNLLTGYSAPPPWQKLVVAPLGLRRRIRDEIERTRAAARDGRSARVVIKTNALVDPEIIEALAAASRDGVEVVLLVRGPCTMRVGQPGRTDAVVVRTLVDRFLEHSRVFHFRVDDEDAVFITSTDVMPRNFDGRVEVMLPVEDPALRRRIVDEILALELSDDTKTSVLGPDGAHRRGPAGGRVRAQLELARRARARAHAPEDTDQRRRFGP
jgi:polyphosphate kinase